MVSLSVLSAMAMEEAALAIDGGRVVSKRRRFLGLGGLAEGWSFVTL